MSAYPIPEGVEHHRWQLLHQGHYDQLQQIIDPAAHFQHHWQLELNIHHHYHVLWPVWIGQLRAMTPTIELYKHVCDLLGTKALVRPLVMALGWSNDPEVADYIRYSLYEDHVYDSYEQYLADRR